MLHPGLCEQVINNALTGELAEIPEARKSVAPIDKAEASKVLAQYLADVVQKGLDNVLDNGGDISAQIGLTNQIVNLIQNTTKEADFAALGVDRRAEQLLALLRETDPRLAVGKTAADIERPETSIAQSSLFTGAVHEPQMFTELKKEIVSADRIDMLVSFIKWSGLRLIMDELREFTQNGGELRIITLSSWFRDFIFTRFMVDSARKKRFSNRLTGASVGLILNMLIMGVWHGLEGHYILYGLYHGILLAVVEVYQKKSKFYKKYRNNKCYVVCSWFINLNIVMLGFLIFSGYLTEVWNLILTRF